MRLGKSVVWSIGKMKIGNHDFCVWFVCSSGKTEAAAREEGQKPTQDTASQSKERYDSQEMCF